MKRITLTAIAALLLAGCALTQDVTKAHAAVKDNTEQACAKFSGED
jgi:hypothetical protein